MLFQNTGVPEVDFQTEASRLIIVSDLRSALPGVDPEQTSLPEREFRTQGAFGEVASLAPATEIELRFAMDTVRHAHWSAEWDRRCVAAGDDLKAATRAQVNAIARLRASIAASREVSRLQRERHERSLKWSNQMAFFEDGKATNLLLARLLDKSSGTTFAEAMVRHTEVLAEANARAEKIAEEAAATARAEARNRMRRAVEWIAPRVILAVDWRKTSQGLAHAQRHQTERYPACLGAAALRHVHHAARPCSYYRHEGED